MRLKASASRARRELVHSVAARLGVYRTFGPPALVGAKRIVFVCKGNICRSPFAEAVCTSMGRRSASFGLDAIDDREADPTAVKVAAALGQSLSMHRTRKLTQDRLSEGDILLCMSPDQAYRVRREFPGFSVGLLGLWNEPRAPLIFDPYGMPEDDFFRSFRLIQASVSGLVSGTRG